MPIETTNQAITAQLTDYEPRPAQVAMVNTIWTALQSGQTSIIEAGTGSGKSFGYLIPAILSQTRPIVVSTGTITLQEQLLQKDIPFIAQAAGLPDLNVQLVKGRRNYLCLQKLQEFERGLSTGTPENLYSTLLKTAWADGWKGDKARLDTEIPAQIWAEIQSDGEDCLGKKCWYYRDNPYRMAREHLDQADILVVNHALYLQDLISGQALLPAHDAVIFDEAHQLKGFALNAFTARIGRFATRKLLRKIDRRLQVVPDEFMGAVAQVEAGLLDWLMAFRKSTFRIYPDSRFQYLIEEQLAVLCELRLWLAAMDPLAGVTLTSELERDIRLVQRHKLLDQLDTLVERWAFFREETVGDPARVERVNWAEVNANRLYYEIHSTPLDIAESLSKTLWSRKTAILTSATLAVNSHLQGFRKDLGLPTESDNMTMDRVMDSPFDYTHQCELYLPRAMPDPNDPLYTAAVVEETLRILKYTQGRAFVLFTSYSAMERVSQAVIQRTPFTCKTQGDLPRHRLVEWFKAEPNAVLFATASFWEGVDIPGDALSAVIIDRIPFAAPDDPVHQATVERLKRRGEDWFSTYALSHAAIRLKQGVGRLIRRKEDRGLVALLDPRLTTKGYGKTLLNSLPPARQIRALDESRLFRTDTACTMAR
jgi:ATP-dependent DNA helicase DinG